MKRVKKKDLAIYGGEPVRRKKMPGRRLFGERELEAVSKLFKKAWDDDSDFGFQSLAEELYTADFCAFQKEGGYADAVATGSAAIFVAIQALHLPESSPILVSPVTDPGSISGSILLGHPLIIADSMPNQFNMGPEQFENAITDDVQAAILTHLGGNPLEMDAIMEIAVKHNIKIIEDCSQAHGAYYNGRRVGCFGEIGVFSTMWSKAHATGGCGGIVYTKDKDLYRQIRYASDRGKPLPSEGVRVKDPRLNYFPALNLNLDEISCAIGQESLRQLESRMDRRRKIIKRIDNALSGSNSLEPLRSNPSSISSPFFHTIIVNTNNLIVSKGDFCNAIIAEGIPINPDYRFVVSEWPWVADHIVGSLNTPNAKNFRKTSFNILFHERYFDGDVRDIINSLIKVDSCLSQ